MVALVVDISTADANPLNPLGFKLRRIIWEALDAAQKDPNITSIILTGGSSKNFSAGADLTEFGSDVGNSFPLNELVQRLEDSDKPIVAAIQGNALGGGLEVALSCHYRVADTSGRFALPEVNVGVIPGAGGTQRLPRLIGVGRALDMILTGKTIGATDALTFGLVDQLARQNETVLECAKRWAAWAELMPVRDRRTGRLPLKESPIELGIVLSSAASKLPPVSMGGEGVHEAMKAVRACQLPLEQGLQVELECFLRTLLGAQGNARRHAFFAIRKAQKPIGRPPSNHILISRSSKALTAAVVGAGLMGSGIAMVLLQAGFTVYLVDLYPASLKKGVAFITGSVASSVKKGKISRSMGEAMGASLKSTTRLEDLGGCSLVVEAVIEKMEVKQKIFSQLDKITPAAALLLSNTSTLDIDEMASVLTAQRRRQFAGWHFFSPAHVMKLVEIVRGKDTSLDTLCVLQHLTKKIKKIGVIVGNCDGFVGNRMLIPYGAESTFLLQEGRSTISRVDKAILKFGMALGPFQMGDLAGLDIGFNIRVARGWTTSDGKPGRNRPDRYPELGDAIVAELKRLGQKSGKGWYDYDPKVGKGRKGLPSTEVSELIERFAGKSEAHYSDQQIIERLLFPMVNLGFRCLEEGIARQPSDIDVVYLYGYGWPAYRGGPMYWADHEIGLERVLSSLKEMSKMFPTTDYFVPSRLLKECVARSVTLEEYYARGMNDETSLLAKL